MDYTLVVVGTMFPRTLAQRLGFAPDDATVTDGVWTIDARAPLGLELVLFGEQGRMNAHFRADKTLPAKAWRSAVRLVERVLETGDEDFTFTAFDRHVVIERVDGVVRRLPGDFVYRDPGSILIDEIGRHADFLALAETVVGAHTALEARRVALMLRQAADRIDELLPRPARAVTDQAPERTVRALLVDQYEFPALDETLLVAADLEALGWVRSLAPEAARAAAALVLEIAGDSGHPLLREHQRDTDFRWDDDVETWAWFGHFAHRIADRVDALLAPLEPTTERVVVEAFAAHLDDSDLWGATIDQLLVAADQAARDLAMAPTACDVAARLRALTEHDDLTFRLRRSSNYPWPELQAVARRIADRIDALVP
ncbi:hypothetical protein OJ998_07710 [Solirubrobacter taibaiensis]|nr:hypothetical protein [Solirubrobacter taibaiensis]